MADHHEIYQQNAVVYDNLVSHEDYSGRLAVTSVYCI